MRDYKKIIPLLLSIILLILFNNHSYSQSIAKIENIAFNREGSMMIITYDIVKAQTGETFNIGVKLNNYALKIHRLKISNEIRSNKSSLA